MTTKRILVEITEKGSTKARSNIQQVGNQAAATQSQVAGLRNNLRLLDSTEKKNARTNKALGKSLKDAGSSADLLGAKTFIAEKQIRKINRSISKTISLSSGLSAVIGGLALILGGSNVIQLADQYTLLNSRLKIVTESEKNLIETEAQLYDISQDTRVALAGTVDLYTRLARSTKQLGTSQEDLYTATTAINQSLKVSGVTAREANASLIQFSQGLASGALRGDELRSVLEQTPRLAEAIATGMDVTIGQLRLLGAEGKLTTEAVLTALISQSEQIQSEFDQVRITATDGLTAMSNALLLFVGTADQMLGITNAIAQGLIFLADNIWIVVAAATALSAIMLTIFRGSILAAIHATRAAITFLALEMATAAIATKGFAVALLAIATNPVVIAISLLTAALALHFYTMKKGIQDSNAALNDLSKTADKASKATGGLLQEMAKFRTSLPQILELDAAFQQTFSDISGVNKEFRDLIAAGYSKGLATDQIFLNTKIKDTQEKLNTLDAAQKRATSTSSALLSVDVVGIAVRKKKIESLKTELAITKRLSEANKKKAAEEAPITAAANAAQIKAAENLQIEFERLTLSRADFEIKQAARSRDKVIDILGESAKAYEVFDLKVTKIRGAATDRYIKNLIKEDLAFLQNQLKVKKADAEKLAIREDLSNQINILTGNDTAVFEAELAKQVAIYRAAKATELEIAKFAALKRQEFQLETSENITDYIKRSTKDAVDAAKMQQQAFDSVLSSTTDAITKAITEGGSGWRDWVNAIIADLVRIQIRALLVKTVLGGISGFGGGIQMSNTPGLSPGVPIPSSPGAGFANGGITSGSNRGHLELMHGTEAVVPLPDGRSIPVDLGTSRGGGMPNITIINQGTPQTVTGSSMDQLSNTATLIVKDIESGGPIGSAVIGSVQENIEGNGSLRRAIRRNR